MEKTYIFYKHSLEAHICIVFDLGENYNPVISFMWIGRLIYWLTPLILCGM